MSRISRGGSVGITRPGPGPGATVALAAAGATAVAAFDAAVGDTPPLSELLVVFPLIAAARATPVPLLGLGCYCLALAIALGVPNDRFAHDDHAVAVAVVAVGGLLAVLISRLRSGREAVAMRLSAQYDVARTLARSPALGAAAPEVLERIGTTFGWRFGSIWTVGRSGALACEQCWSASSGSKGGGSEDGFLQLTRQLSFEPGVGLPGRVWASAEPAWIADVTTDSNFPRAEAAAAAGLHGAVGFPILSGGRVLGVTEFFSTEVREPDPALLDFMAAFGNQLGEYIERRRAEDERARLLGLERAARLDAAQARDQLEAILQGVADGVTAQAPDGRLVFANEAAVRTLGYESSEALLAAPPEEVMANFEIFDEEGRPFPLEELPGRKALRGERPPDQLLRFRVRATGEERWSVVKATPIRDDEGGVVMAINVFEDITDHKRSEQGQRFLAESSRALSTSLDFATTLRRVAELAVPEVADWCVIDMQQEDGSLERVAAVHADPDEVARLMEMNRRYPPARDGPGVAAVLRTGESELYPEIPDDLLVASARDEEHLAMIRRFGLSSAMVVPMVSRGRAIGAISFASGPSGRRFDEETLGLAEELGRRAGIAVENARLFGERAYIAHTLQESLLPPDLPSIQGVEVAARFHPAGEGNEVGGDFYDVFQTGRCWTVVMGDVCGKGADAAAVTALARYTLRAAALQDPQPSRTLRLLNDALLRQRTDKRFCTVAYGQLIPGDSGLEVEVSSGGHPLPLLLRSDGAVEPVGAHGTLLGVVHDPDLHDRRTALRQGDALVFYTDGVTEARGPAGELGEDQLESLLASCVGLDAGGIAERVESTALELQQGRARDDIAVLVLRAGRAEASSDGGGLTA